MAKRRKKRQIYTPQQRSTILSAASRDGLTAAQVKRKFGVTPVTYYSWRKKSGATRKHGGSTLRRLGGGTLETQLRSEVQTRVRQVLPEIVRSEVNSYLNTLFTTGHGRRRGQRV